MNKFHWALGVTAVLLAVGASGATPQAADRAAPGTVYMEPPTLEALGLEWPLSGDDNRNATVSIRYRKKGTENWREGLPPLRIGGEETRYLSLDFTAPRMFAGSLFDLEPGTSYEISLRMADPDGVEGAAEQRIDPGPAIGLS